MKNWETIAKENMIALRIYHKKGLKEFSNILNLNFSTLYRIEEENLKIHLWHLSKLCDFYKIDVKFFFEELSLETKKQLEKQKTQSNYEFNSFFAKEIKNKINKYSNHQSLNWEEVARDKIKLFRHNKKLSLKEFSSAIGYSFSAISKIENGEQRLKISFLSKLSDVYDIDISFFFIEVDSIKQSEMEKKKEGLKTKIISLANEGFLIKEIANKLNCSRSHVSGVLNSHSITSKTLKERRTKEEILKLAEEGYLVTEIKKKTNCEKELIKDTLNGTKYTEEYLKNNRENELINAISILDSGGFTKYQIARTINKSEEFVNDLFNKI